MTNSCFFFPESTTQMPTTPVTSMPPSTGLNFKIIVERNIFLHLYTTSIKLFSSRHSNAKIGTYTGLLKLNVSTSYFIALQAQQSVTRVWKMLRSQPPRLWPQEAPQISLRYLQATRLLLKSQSQTLRRHRSHLSWHHSQRSLL